MDGAYAAIGQPVIGKKQIINATVPMSELQTYAPEMKSMTGGRGMFSVEFSHYDEVPAQTSQKLIEEIKKNNNR